MAREQVKRKPAAKTPAPILDGGVLVREGRVVSDDPWTFLADGEDGPVVGDLVVPFHRFVEQRDFWLSRASGRLGLLVGPADKVEDIAQDVNRFALIAVAFPAFRDGRGFTSARLLRERYGYEGELRAVGDVLPDLLFYLLRCGFTSFTLKAPDPEAAYARAVKTFSVSYQAASDARTPVHRLRAAKKKGAGS